MFKRQTPLTILQNTRELFWPSMGWIRAFKYAKLRVIRLSDTSRKIAAGLAIGAAISFTPLVGTHFIQAAFIAYFTRANVLASLIGTFVGNPWTFPFMWWAAIKFGSFLFELMGLPATVALPEIINTSILWDVFTSEPLRIFLPWALGGYLMALMAWPLFYFIFYHMVKGAKLARSKVKLHKAHKEAKKITGQEE